LTAQSSHSTIIVMRRSLLFTLLIAWCLALLSVRIGRSGTWMFLFLGWNLFLAAIPLAASELLMRARSTLMRTSWLAVWLLFLPNAPYILTDLIHLRPRPGIPMWYDLALLLSCAGTGLLMGYTSLVDVQALVTKRRGAVAGWCVAVAALLLSAFGIYIGRFLRWNSWDVLANPAALFLDIATRLIDPFAHPRTLSVTLVFGVMLTLGYVAIRCGTMPSCTNPPHRPWDASMRSTSGRRS
jgi:uncharacterized membrane protein